MSKLFGNWGGGSAAKSSAPPQEEKRAAPKKRGASPQEMMMDMCEDRSPSPDRNVMMSLKSGAQAQGMMKQQMQVDSMEDLSDELGA